MANMRQGFQNVELIDKVIASIKTRAFSMARWDCCIGGHMARVTGADIYATNDPELLGAMKLGIPENDALELFCTNLDADREEAIRVLEILRDEGVVAWKRARREVQRSEAERQRLEAEAWEADHWQPMTTLDRLYERFEELCTKARLAI